MVLTTDGKEVLVFYETGETGPCKGENQDAFESRAGDIADVYGLLLSENTVSVCGEEKYYLRTTSEIIETSE